MRQLGWCSPFTALWAETWTDLVGSAGSVAECRRSRSEATAEREEDLLSLEMRRDVFEAWDSRMASQYQHVHSE